MKLRPKRRTMEHDGRIKCDSTYNEEDGSYGVEIEGQMG